MLFSGKKVLVIGLKRSGVACAKVLCEMGADVTVNDMQPEAALMDSITELDAKNVRLALGRSPEGLCEGKDLIVLSPAVPITQKDVWKAKLSGIEVIGEIELGYRLCKAPIVAITGTNGKTTTTMLTGEIFRNSVVKTHVLGNMGLPIVAEVGKIAENDIVVAEIAGPQLESAVHFRPKVCAFLNLSEDHIDRFGSMDKYIEAKTKIFANQEETDFAVLNADDSIVSGYSRLTKARPLYFSRFKTGFDGAFVKKDRIVFRMNGFECDICGSGELKIPGKHNLENALAAVACSMCVGVDPIAVRKALTTFTGVEHRIESVCEVNGVRFINDSKGTNPDSTIKAIESMDRPTVLMLGGYEKGSNFLPMFETFGGKIKAVVALGATASRIMETAKKAKYRNAFLCEGTFEDAVRMAYSLADEGDNVLLSPASASYDMFDNFEKRGDYFREIVYRIRDEYGSKED